MNPEYLSYFSEFVEYVGTFVFAISGIRLASAKQFDWFGAYSVGLVTAIGGGTVRDLLLDVTPFWMTTPLYLVCSAVALVWVILFSRYPFHLDKTFTVFDSLGLALFTVVGIEKSIAVGYPLWVGIVMGCITGCLGGIFRDTLCNELPLVFRKELYAMACLIGGFFYALCHWMNLPLLINELVCGAGVLIVRFIAVKWNISLPVLKGTD